MIHTKPCEAWAEKLAARHREDLSPTEHAALDAHIASCPACAAVRHEYDLLSTHIRALPAVRPLPQSASGFQWLHAQPRFSVRERARNAWQAFLPTPQGLVTRNRGAGIIALTMGSTGVVALTTIGILALLLTLFLRSPYAPGNSTANTCLLPTSRNNADCQALYKGAIYGSRFDAKSPTMLLSIKQQQRTLSGSTTLPPPVAGTWLITSGSISPNRDIQFTISVNLPPYKLDIWFTGKISSDGRISGSYTTSTGQTGSWSVSPSTGP